MPAALTSLLLAGTAACGTASAGGEPAAGHDTETSSAPAAHRGSAAGAEHGTIPKACAGLRIVRVPSSDPGPPFPEGFLTEPEEFGTYVAGEPFLVVTLDSHGIHFSPSTVHYGSYDLCFVDLRAPDAHRDVSFTFFVSGPRVPMASVEAGTIGSVLFCPGAEAWQLFVDDQPATGIEAPRSWGSLDVESGTGCETVVT